MFFKYFKETKSITRVIVGAFFEHLCSKALTLCVIDPMNTNLEKEREIVQFLIL